MVPGRRRRPAPPRRVENGARDRHGRRAGGIHRRGVGSGGISGVRGVRASSRAVRIRRGGVGDVRIFTGGGGGGVGNRRREGRRSRRRPRGDDGDERRRRRRDGRRARVDVRGRGRVRCVPRAIVRSRVAFLRGPRRVRARRRRVRRLVSPRTFRRRARRRRRRPALRAVSFHAPVRDALRGDAVVGALAIDRSVDDGRARVSTRVGVRAVRRRASRRTDGGRRTRVPAVPRLLHLDRRRRPRRSITARRTRHATRRVVPSVRARRETRARRRPGRRSGRAVHARRARRHRAERFVAAIGEERRRGENVHPGRPRARRFPRLRARPRASRRVRRRVRGDGSSPRRRDALRRFTPMRRRGIRAAHSRASLLLRERETRGDAVRGGGRVARRAPTAHALEGRDWVLVRRRTRPRRVARRRRRVRRTRRRKKSRMARVASHRVHPRGIVRRVRARGRGKKSGGRTPRVGRPRAADAVRALRVWRRGVRRVPRDGIFPGRGRDARRVSHRGVRVVRGRVGVHVRAVRVVADVRAVDLRRRGRVSLRRARVAVGGGGRARATIGPGAKTPARGCWARPRG